MSVLPKLTSSAPVTAEIKSVCVFCGSGNGADPAYAFEAYGNAINDYYMAQMLLTFFFMYIRTR